MKEQYKIESHYTAFIVTRLSDNKDILFQAEVDIKDLAEHLGYWEPEDPDYTECAKYWLDDHTGIVDVDLSDYFE